MLVVNTCAFIDRAKQESIDTILEMAELKKQAPGRRLVVTGCLAERYRDELQREIPEIDAVLGTGEVPRILEVLDGAADTATMRAQPLTFYNRDPARHGSGRGHSGLRHRPARRISTTPTRRAGWRRPGHYAYLKIAEGCDYKCAFCIIPKMRGHYRSRTDRVDRAAKRERLAARASRSCC